ncbi:MAG TPA: uracil-DNA glycosylase [Candidatus Dormibacteraeota bacterium]|nr:uracil-DNA glycosylase [Candidatus Dormibacteraeota bacterium]
MPVPLDSTRRKKVGDTLRYFEELGIGSFYLDRASSLASSAEPAAAPERSPAAATLALAPPAELFRVTQKPRSLFEAPPLAQVESLETILADLGDCRRCRLCEGRSKIVFGDGSSKAQLVFVGEGPGHDEDVQGLPFVGRAGKLLNQMIEAMGLRRQDVYICNVVKCRPPGNRAPEKDEMATCSPFLLRQLAVISPKVIVCLGAIASKALLETEKGISQFRGQWLEFRGIPLMATYHPAYLLRNPHAKADVWKDLQKVMAALGLPSKKAPRP